MTTPTERRFTAGRVELRTRNDKRSIGGYAAVFDKPSQNLGGFIEVVSRSFFNKSRGDGWPDVMARYNHDDNMLLGTTAARTLELEIDDQGLLYTVTPPTSRADIVELVERGDVNKSSFAFRTYEDDWGLSEQGFPQRTLVSGQLVDVAPVNSPAYLDTSVVMRSLRDGALQSLATKMNADLDEVRALSEQDALKKFFVRTDRSGKPTPKPPTTLGAAALLQLDMIRENGI